MSIFGIAWNLRQSSKIKENQKSTSEIANKSALLQEKLDSQEESLNRLAIICEAMWELLKNRANFTEEELDVIINRISEDKIIASGANPDTSIRCPRCNAVVNAKLGRCEFCGETVEVQNKDVKLQSRDVSIFRPDV